MAHGGCRSIAAVNTTQPPPRSVKISRGRNPTCVAALKQHDKRQEVGLCHDDLVTTPHHVPYSGHTCWEALYDAGHGEQRKACWEDDAMNRLNTENTTPAMPNSQVTGAQHGPNAAGIATARAKAHPQNYLHWKEERQEDGLRRDE